VQAKKIVSLYLIIISASRNAKKNMLQKIKRQQCLDCYSKFPLRYYDKSLDEEIYNDPDTVAHYWLRLETKTKIHRRNLLVSEIVKLYKGLGIERLIFLCDANTPWITRNSYNRTDFKHVVKAVEYLKSNKIGVRFNGGVIVEISELSEFIGHFYVLTWTDALFSYYNFMDESQSIIGYIHYDGEVQITPINEDAKTKFLSAVKKTQFIDSHRKGTDRI
jgi:hypothetical protein